jgi:hypothetical protein
MSDQSLEDRMTEILVSLVPQLASAVRDHLTMLVGGGGASAATRGKPRGGTEKHTYPEHCLYPGCTNPRGGPKFTYMCDDHRDTPKNRRAKLLAD